MDATKYSKLSGLIQHNVILSQFWRLGVRHRIAGEAMLPLKAPRENPFLPRPSFLWLPANIGPSWLVAVLLQSPPRLHVAFFHTCLCLCPNLSFLIKLSVIGFTVNTNQV